MKARAAAVQGGLAAAALLAAWATWQRPADRTDEGDKILLDLARRDLEQVRYEDAKKVVELITRDDAVWMVERQKPPVPPAAKPSADGGVAETQSKPPEPVVVKPPRELKGGDQAGKLWERFAPLRASRSLGALDAAKLKELGLDSDEKSLEVKARGASHRFRVATASGTGSTYLRDDRDGTVWLLRGTMLSDLEAAASRLPDRRFHAFQSEEFDTLAVKAGGRDKSYVVPSPGKLAAKESPENADDFARNWHDRVFRMYAVDLLGKGEVPPGGEPTVELRVDYARGTRSVGWLEMGRSGSDVYARSENTAGWVKVATGADSMLREAPRVAGGETKDEPKGDAKKSDADAKKTEPKSEKKAEAKTK